MCMIHVSATEYLHTNAVLLCKLKSWKLAHKTLNSYLPSLDCKNMGQISWLNFPNCGFQAPALVRPLAAWVRTFLLRDILSWFTSLGSREKRKENPRCCPASWPRHLDSCSVVGSVWSRRLLIPLLKTSVPSPKTPPLSTYILLLRTLVG